MSDLEIQMILKAFDDFKKTVSDSMEQVNASVNRIGEVVFGKEGELIGHCEKIRNLESEVQEIKIDAAKKSNANLAAIENKVQKKWTIDIVLVIKWLKKNWHWIAILLGSNLASWIESKYHIIFGG